MFFLSGQSVQRAGVRLDNEALQNVIRFLLLTFRYVSSYFFYSEYDLLKWITGECVFSLSGHVYSLSILHVDRFGQSNVSAS